DDDFAVLFAGKLEAVKRPLDAVRAVARLGPRARLLIAGAGSLADALRAEAARTGARGAGAGFLNQSEMPRAYAAADCPVLPGREAWGLVVNEALATGLPCVVSDGVGSAADLVVPSETGETFAIGDVDALAAAIERVRARGDRGDWAAACRARVAQHSLDRAAAGLVAACRVVADRRAPVGVPRVLACCGTMVIVSGLERATFEVL